MLGGAMGESMLTTSDATAQVWVSEGRRRMMRGQAGGGARRGDEWLSKLVEDVRICCCGGAVRS